MVELWSSGRQLPRREPWVGAGEGGAAALQTEAVKNNTLGPPYVAATDERAENYTPVRNHGSRSERTGRCGFSFRSRSIFSKRC